MSNPTDGPGNFIDEMVTEDVANGKHGGRVQTRFPPEPNGYLHIGHAKAIVLNFTLAKKHNGACNLRFDDTNPVAEDSQFVDAIKKDIQWLGFDWGEREFYASDYFDKLYEFAQGLIRRNLAYVDSQNEEAIREGRGNFYKPGINSPFRDRSAEENLALLEGMKNGEYDEGTHVLRAKIDMQSKDLKLRDPLMYRILRAPHHRTGNKWNIYPMYDFAHGQSDAIEGVTHSLCSLEFKNHRNLYNWFLEKLEFDDPPEQTEFARLALDYMTLSKRRLKRLVDEGHVRSWDDPRMPTLSGMRRRGYTPEAIVKFCQRIGVAKKNGVVDIGLLEHEIREDLNARTPRIMGVLRPLKVTLTNFEEGELWFEAPLHPTEQSFGTRKVPLSKHLYIERDDFMEEPVKKWFRLSPDKEVRLRYACIIRCNEIVKDENGDVVELRCTWDPDSKGGTPADGRKIKGTLHWLSAQHAKEAEVRIYDRLFNVENPDDVEEGEDFVQHLNPNSEEVLHGCQLEPYALEVARTTQVQFERLGYFVQDESSSEQSLVYNQTITLKDTWAKIAKQQGR